MTSAAVDTLARTLWGEARGESEIGMEAVACVILNRAKRPGWWGRDIESVCLKPYQFSCWLKNDPNYPKLLAVNDQDMAFRVALKIAHETVDGQLQDITGGSCWYYERHSPPPYWVKHLTFVRQIGNHLFYKDR